MIDLLFIKKQFKKDKIIVVSCTFKFETQKQII
jgi:hypothetical protein